jgi:hypothetical protein
VPETTDLYQHPEFLRRSLEGRELVFCNKCFGLFWVPKAVLVEWNKGNRYGQYYDEHQRGNKEHCNGTPIFASDAEGEVLQAILTRLSRKQYKVIGDPNGT